MKPSWRTAPAICANVAMPNCPSTAGASTAYTSPRPRMRSITCTICEVSLIAPKGQEATHAPQEMHRS